MKIPSFKLPAVTPPKLELGKLANTVRKAIEDRFQKLNCLVNPGATEVALARGLLGPGSSELEARHLLATSPGLAERLTLFADLGAAAATDDELREVAMRALRSGLMDGTVRAPLLVEKLGLSALAAQCARDLGFEKIEVKDGRSWVDGHDLGPAGQDLSALGKALHRLRYGVDAMIPPNSPVDASAKDFSVANAQWSSQLSLLAYRDEATIRRQLSAWGFDLDTLSFVNDPASDTQGYVVADKKGNLFTIFRGTESNRDWETDVKFGMTSPDWGGGSLKVHGGMSEALDSAWPQVESALAKARGKVGSEAPVIFAGHSLGGGLSELAAMRAVKTGLVSSAAAQVYPLGAPRAGDVGFATEFQRLLPRTYRIVNYREGPIATQDLVTQVPPVWMGFRHAGNMIRLDEGGFQKIGAGDGRARAPLPPGEEPVPADPAIEAMTEEQLRALLSKPRPVGGMPESGPQGALSLTLPSLQFHSGVEYSVRLGNASVRAEVPWQAPPQALWR
ncbi:MAG: hypothetical protein HYZ28_19555 [Myxococcales bacterium]|nr:hypothetical protein [Myxococcales bacterium]